MEVRDAGDWVDVVDVGDRDVGFDTQPRSGGKCGLPVNDRIGIPVVDYPLKVDIP